VTLATLKEVPVVIFFLPPDHAWVAVVTSDFSRPYMLGVAKRGEAGYWPRPEMGNFSSYDKAAGRATELNLDAGLTKEQAFEIQVSSMFPRPGAESMPKGVTS
jgi:hypothetical protein